MAIDTPSLTLSRCIDDECPGRGHGGAGGGGRFDGRPNTSFVGGRN